MCSSVAFGTVTWPCSCHHRPPSPGRLHLPKGKLSRIEHAPPPAMPHRPDFMWVGLGWAWGPDNNPPTPGKALFLRSALLPTPALSSCIWAPTRVAWGLETFTNVFQPPSSAIPSPLPRASQASGTAVGGWGCQCHLPPPPRLPCVLRVGRPRETPVPPQPRLRIQRAVQALGLGCPKTPGRGPSEAPAREAGLLGGAPVGLQWGVRELRAGEAG